MKSKFVLTSIIILGTTLLFMQVVNAGDTQPIPADVAAIEAQEAYEKLLGDIETDRFAVVDDLVNRFAKDEEIVEELRATLDSTSAMELAEIVRNANSLDDVTKVLTGKTPEQLAEDILELGNLDKDYVFTPVRPCRIVDTRKGGGGVFLPDQVREFFVYGTTNIVNQGGNPAGCPSPKGEPRGVHINVTAVPQSEQGNFAAFPANISPPQASLVNYKAGVQNIANAASVKTHYQLGAGGLKIINRAGTSHLVVDVLGYYHEVDENEFKVRFAGVAGLSGTNLVVGGGCTNYDTGQISIFAPGPGMIKVEAEMVMHLKGHKLGEHDDMRAYIGTTPSDCTYIDEVSGYRATHWLIAHTEPEWSSSEHYEPMTVSRTFHVSGSGTKTYYLNGKRWAGSSTGGFAFASIKAFYYPDK